ncbi:MAG: hypothetical protein ACE5F9_02415 [Phycisphaerae bacterium]
MSEERGSAIPEPTGWRDATMTFVDVPTLGRLIRRAALVAASQHLSHGVEREAEMRAVSESPRITTGG